MRYKFYREHKYVSFALNDLERLIAKTDFRDPNQTLEVKKKFDAVVQMLKGHAHYEDTTLHALLRAKHSIVYEHIEAEHGQLEEALTNLQNMLTKTLESTNEEEKIERGYQFYLWYRKFVGDNLLHLHEEETIILPELQKLYSDEELRAVECNTYRYMTVNEMIDMLKELFPHMNASDREAFLTDIKECEPKKFLEVWHAIRKLLDSKEQNALLQKLDITY